MGRTREEQETSIIFNEDGDFASIWTFSPRIQRLLAKRGHKAAKPEGPYIFDKSLISIRGKRAKRAASVASLEALRKAREAR